MKITHIAAACGLLLVATGGSANSKPLSLSTFESSDFCRRYSCKKEDGWALKNGDYNNSFSTNITPEASLDVSTRGEAIRKVGLIFFGRNKLASTDFEFIDSLFSELGASDIKETLEKVRLRVDKQVFDLKKTQVVRAGSLKIWIGKVGKQQTVAIEVFGNSGLTSNVGMTLDGDQFLEKPKTSCKLIFREVALVATFCPPGTSIKNMVEDFTAVAKVIVRQFKQRAAPVVFDVFNSEKKSPKNWTDYTKLPDYYKFQSHTITIQNGAPSEIQCYKDGRKTACNS